MIPALENEVTLQFERGMPHLFRIGYWRIALRIFLHGDDHRFHPYFYFRNLWVHFFNEVVFEFG